MVRIDIFSIVFLFFPEQYFDYLRILIPPEEF